MKIKVKYVDGTTLEFVNVKEIRNDVIKIGSNEPHVLLYKKTGIAKYIPKSWIKSIKITEF